MKHPKARSRPPRVAVCGESLFSRLGSLSCRCARPLKRRIIFILPRAAARKHSNLQKEQRAKVSTGERNKGGGGRRGVLYTGPARVRDERRQNSITKVTVVTSSRSRSQAPRFCLCSFARPFAPYSLAIAYSRSTVFPFFFSLLTYCRYVCRCASLNTHLAGFSARNSVNWSARYSSENYDN